MVQNFEKEFNKKSTSISNYSYFRIPLGFSPSVDFWQILSQTDFDLKSGSRKQQYQMEITKYADWMKDKSDNYRWVGSTWTDAWLNTPRQKTASSRFSNLPGSLNNFRHFEIKVSEMKYRKNSVNIDILDYNTYYFWKQQAIRSPIRTQQ